MVGVGKPAKIKGHVLKAEHDLHFTADAIKIGYFDWALTGCYYACYHAALALIMTRGYSSKNHMATLCVLIKEFYKRDLDEEDVRLFSDMLDYQDLLSYVQSKIRREDAAYKTGIRFDGQEAEMMRLKASLFVDKIKSILGWPD